MNTMRPRLDRMIHFSSLILKLQDVIRAFYLPRGDKENDVEHSYHLAMMAWYLNDSCDLKLDTDRLLKYALLHDLVEAYVGDVSAFDSKGRIGKLERESNALKRFAKEFPEIQEMAPYIAGYMRHDDPESKFVYALDKLLPMIMIYLDNGRTWLEDGFSFTDIHSVQGDKIALSEPVNELYLQLTKIFSSRPELFAR